MVMVVKETAQQHGMDLLCSVSLCRAATATIDEQTILSIIAWPQQNN